MCHNCVTTASQMGHFSTATNALHFRRWGSSFGNRGGTAQSQHRNERDLTAAIGFSRQDEDFNAEGGYLFLASDGISGSSKNRGRRRLCVEDYVVTF